MTILMVVTWVVLFVLTIVAFSKGLILMSPDEDVAKDSITINLTGRKSQNDDDIEKAGPF